MTKIKISHLLVDEQLGTIEQVRVPRQVAELSDFELASISAELLQERFDQVNYTHLAGLAPWRVLVKRATDSAPAEWSPIANEFDFVQLASSLGITEPPPELSERRAAVKQLLVQALGSEALVLKLVWSKQ